MQKAIEPNPTLQLQQRLLIASVVNQINQMIRSAAHLGEILRFSCQLLAQTLACKSVRVLLPQDDDQQTLVIWGEYSQSTCAIDLGDALLPQDHPYLQQVLLQSTPLASTQAHVARDGRELTCSVLAIATQYGGQVNSVIEVQQCDDPTGETASHRPRQWLDWESQLLQEVAGQLAIVIHQNMLHTEMKHRIVRESLLRLITNQIRSSLDLNVILNTVVQQVRELLNTDRVVIYQFQQDWQGTVVVENVLPAWTSVLGEMGQDNCFSSQYAELYRGGRVRGIHNVCEAGLDECHVNFLQRLQVQANLIVPILQNTTADELDPTAEEQKSPKLWGLLIAHECRSPRHWQAWEKELMQQLGDQIAIAIQQAELYTQVRINAARSQAQAEQLQNTLEELRSTQIQLIQSEKLSSLGQMVAGIAHEINNATNFIHANLPYVQQYAAVLEQAIALCTDCYPEAKEAIAARFATLEVDFVRQDFPQLIQSMQTGTGRIRDIVSTLRNFSRLDETDCKAVDVHEGIDSSLVILRHRIDPQVKIHKDYGSLPPVECNAGQINQVFLNLLSNALDAGGNSAEITIRTWQPHPDAVIISIRDNGSGVPEEIVNRIFDPFFTTKPVGQGTGLGLSICHQIIVKQHRGAIRCINHPNQGAEFQIELPISR
ncbi:MAG: ATP-binding protein [Oculatellaceae cyanobacterium bins.114]|nr:ATP-binding protein [Oculatellaceae cyanobacterium bins.114]